MKHIKTAESRIGLEKEDMKRTFNAIVEVLRALATAMLSHL